MSTDSLSIALWAANLAAPCTGIDAWAAAVDECMRAARAEAAELLVMPEYAAEQWLSFGPHDLRPDQEIPWLAEHASAALDALRPLPAKHGMGLLAGTMPFWVDEGRDGAPPIVNRAHLLLPDGRICTQDKLCLTPPEKDPAGWHLSTGRTLQIVQWAGLRIATLICLDIELPALAARLAPHGLDLVLVPSMTEKRAGYARVFSCAKARAVELQSAVCAVGCVGAASTGRPRFPNVSGAAVFVPCEEALGHTGTWCEIPARRAVQGPGEMLLARDLPLGLIRSMRAGRAEVWPGAWSAEHVEIVEAETERVDAADRYSVRGAGP